MASSKPPRSVIYTYDARNELRVIYKSDIKKRGLAQAERYQDFLIAGIDALATTYEDGKRIDGFPELRSLTLKQGRSRWDDGHIVIYEVDEPAGTVNVLHLYHTKMDVHGRLVSEYR